ncbi:hypothetical protein DPMN_108586 [Dreissena polymorpha]|uniref:Uncharacterized protein n=1 Tax=Dreissena polymorpha TaxID=45954 RepID=A0A9D4K8T6_DREPO|nr:hypothetical protein DPMN_108586 [Dreissena polymorpha]
MRGGLREKKAKYTEMLEASNQRGWRNWLFPIEVGARGFCEQSVCQLMSAIGSTDRDRRRTIQKMPRCRTVSVCRLMSAIGSTGRDRRWTIQKMPRCRTVDEQAVAEARQNGRSRAIDIYRSYGGPNLPRCPWFKGETLTTEGLHADDECRSTIHNHHKT